MQRRAIEQLAKGEGNAVSVLGGIVVKGHPSLKANLALTAATGSTRSVDDPDFFRAFQQHGMPMIDFAEGTRGANANVLELTYIENAETLATTPLQIAINLPLAADETILPLTFDGEFVRLCGEAYKQDDGSTIVTVDDASSTAIVPFDTAAFSGLNSLT